MSDEIEIDLDRVKIRDCNIKVVKIHIPTKRKQNEDTRAKKKFKFGKEEYTVNWFTTPKKQTCSYQCQVCGKGFKDSTALLYHEIYHPQPVKSAASLAIPDETASRLSGEGIIKSTVNKGGVSNLKRVRVKSSLDNSIPRIRDYNKNNELIVTKPNSDSASNVSITSSDLINNLKTGSDLTNNLKTGSDLTNNKKTLAIRISKISDSGWKINKPSAKQQRSNAGNTLNNSKTELSSESDIEIVESNELASTRAESKELASTRAETKELASTRAESKELASTRAETKELASTGAESKELASTRAESKELASTRAESKELASTRAESKELASTRVESKNLASTRAESNKLASSLAASVETGEPAAAPNVSLESCASSLGGDSGEDSEVVCYGAGKKPRWNLARTPQSVWRKKRRRLNKSQEKNTTIDKDTSDIKNKSYNNTSSGKDQLVPQKLCDKLETSKRSAVDGLILETNANDLGGDTNIATNSKKLPENDTLNDQKVNDSNSKVKSSKDKKMQSKASIINNRVKSNNQTITDYLDNKNELKEAFAVKSTESVKIINKVFEPTDLDTESDSDVTILSEIKANDKNTDDKVSSVDQKKVSKKLVKHPHGGLNGTAKGLNADIVQTDRDDINVDKLSNTAVKINGSFIDDQPLPDVVNNITATVNVDTTPIKAVFATENGDTKPINEESNAATKTNEESIGGVTEIVSVNDHIPHVNGMLPAVGDVDDNDDFDDDDGSKGGTSPNYVHNLLKPVHMSDSDLDEIQAVCEKVNSAAASPSTSSPGKPLSHARSFTMLENNNSDISLILEKFEGSSIPGIFENGQEVGITEVASMTSSSNMMCSTTNMLTSTTSLSLTTPAPPLELFPHQMFEDDIAEFGFKPGTIEQEKNNQTSLIKPRLSSKIKSTKKSKLKLTTSVSNSTSRRHLKSSNLNEGRPSDSSSSEQNMALSDRKTKRKRRRSSSSQSHVTRRSSTTSSSSSSKRPRLDTGVLEDHGGEEQREDPGGGEQRGSGTRFSERKFTGEKLFMCNHCPLKFSILDNKVVHERTHKEKPFECVFCEMRFSYKLGLKLHMKIHQ